MIDEVEIEIKAGDGGDGCMSFRRERFLPMGGPSGGDGGSGGDVFLCADRGESTLLSYRYQRHFKAKRGGNGLGKDMHGKNGSPLELVVPEGTLVWELSAEGEQLLGDLGSHGQKLLVAHGGTGGKGNAHFVSSTNQAPKLAEQGEPGEEKKLRLEMKVLADVGIIGKPNAGKSTFLSAISAAHPKVASYPFTTIEPELGTVERGWRTYTFVEVPGLIEGAHAGLGLGDQFLRHVERTRMLLFLVDASSDDPMRDVEEVRQEIRLYKNGLLAKPQFLVFNKMDLPAAAEKRRSLAQRARWVDFPTFFISAQQRGGLIPLLDAAIASVEEERKKDQASPPESPQDQPLRIIRQYMRPVVRKEGEAYVVQHAKAERIAWLLDVKNREAVAQFRNELRRFGIGKVLERAGVERGDQVIVGRATIRW